MAKFGIKDFEKFFYIKYNRKHQRICLFKDRFGNCQHLVERTGWLWNKYDGTTTLVGFCELVRQKSPEAHLLCAKHQKTRRSDHDAYHERGLSPIDELMQRINYEYSYAFIPDEGHRTRHEHLLLELDWTSNKEKTDLMEIILDHLDVARQKRASPAPIFNQIQLD
ncbi:hypothetical protein M3Y96_00891800 [Aphelenchoides besseyi]|nr:hypothetical protein M3Y96_00891800 [Aphelenchoides besseyi]